MVEQTINLDNIFQALADQTRRSILRQLTETSLSISELARSYQMSFAAVAKHVVKLEQAGLVSKKRAGKRQVISITPKTIEAAITHLELYEKMWENRLDTLESLIHESK